MRERMDALEQIVPALQLRITAVEDANDDLRTRLREALNETHEV